MVSKKSTGRSAVITGLIIGLATQLLSVALIAYLIYNESVEMTFGIDMAYLVLTISTALGGTVAARKSGKQIAVTAAIAIGLNTLFLAAISILVFGGFGNSALPGLLCILIGYLLSCAICITKGKKSRKRKMRAV